MGICANCGTTLLPGELFCDEECRDAWIAEEYRICKMLNDLAEQEQRCIDNGEDDELGETI